MSLNPLNELKRRLEDDSTPLSKRLCLAKNLVHSHHFPAAPKERILSEWIYKLSVENKISNVELKSVLEWLGSVDDLTGELKSRIIQIVSKYVQQNVLETPDIHQIIIFLENAKVSSQLSQHIDEYLTITVTLLQCLKTEEIKNMELSKKILMNFVKYYKESKKKLEFIVKFLNGENLETVFSYLETECRDSVINVCQNILFPLTKKSFFISYLQTLIRKDNLDELIAEKGDNIQSVLKIMSIFFEFPKQRTQKHQNFLSAFIDVFVTCFKTESQIVFAFYIMIANVLQMKQDYITASMTMDPITFEENPEKINRNLFLKMLEIVLKNDIDISVRLTDTFGEKISKVEIKKNFLSFLQNVMFGQLKLHGKTDKLTVQIVITALKLDPSLIENKIEDIIPPLMALKKNSNLTEIYTEMINCLLETLFKLSRGTLFLNQILPFIKLNLEASNTEQFELRTKVSDSADNIEKLKSKIVYGVDVFPEKCVDVYGKLTTELMFRQNKELVESLLKDFEEFCLVPLEEGRTSPSIVIMTEFMAAILSSILSYSKMADHTVPQHVAEEFWKLFERLQSDCLKTFGSCVLKANDNYLLLPFLKLCLSYSQLKLLNIVYSNYKLELTYSGETSNVFDFSMLVPSLNEAEWTALSGKVTCDEETLALDKLIQLKSTALQILAINKPETESNQSLSDSKSHLIKELNTRPEKIEHFQKIFYNLDKNQCKQLSKSIVKFYLNDELPVEFNVANINDRKLLNALVLEVAKNIAKCMENSDDLTKALGKSEFDIAAFSKSVNTVEYFNEISMTDEDEKVKKCIDLLKELKLPFLEENYQLIAMFVLLAVKKCCHSKKVKKNIDYLFLNIFELSMHPPDLYQVLPVNFIFCLKDPVIMDLLTIKLKNCNPLIIIKGLLESAVKRVRTGNDLIIKIVELLLKNKSRTSNTIETFNDTAFQLNCIVLPLIVKQKKAITSSAHRSILADLQEKLHKVLLETFQNIHFGRKVLSTGNGEEMVENDSNMATLNAIAAYSLTLSRYCETNDGDEIKKLDCLWSGLQFFVEFSIQTIKDGSSKTSHVESSLHLLNVTLRHIKKLESHAMFTKKDTLLTQIWESVLTRLKTVFDKGSSKKCGYIEDVSVLMKFVCELASVECFVSKFVGDLDGLVVFKTPSQISKDQTKSEITSHFVSKYLWTQCLRANTAGPKCNAMTKIIYQKSRNLKSWIRQHYDTNVANRKKRKLDVYDNEVIVKVDDNICELIKINLDVLSEVIFAGKKITLDYKFLDAIFELQHMVHYIMGYNTTGIRCEISWQAFFSLFEGSVAILNSLLVSREELLEDRWPCYMQCYRGLTWILCQRSTSNETLERTVEEKLAELAHSIEKLTQSISKRKKQVSRISAYTVADICTYLEKQAPSKMVRQHLENSVALLIQASDSSYAMAFLKRALAGSVGQMTMNNLYVMYKRYHKYVGNS